MNTSSQKPKSPLILATDMVVESAGFFYGKQFLQHDVNDVISIAFFRRDVKN